MNSTAAKSAPERRYKIGFDKISWNPNAKVRKLFVRRRAKNEARTWETGLPALPAVNKRDQIPQYMLFFDSSPANEHFFFVAKDLSF